MSQATKGALIAVQITRHHEDFDQPLMFRADDLGNAHRNGIIGRPSTSNGAATSIRSSCCVMWAEKRTLPHGCSGDTSAITRVNHPAAKHSVSLPRNA